MLSRDFIFAGKSTIGCTLKCTITNPTFPIKRIILFSFCRCFTTHHFLRPLFSTIGFGTGKEDSCRMDSNRNLEFLWHFYQLFFMLSLPSSACLIEGNAVRSHYMKCVTIVDTYTHKREKIYITFPYLGI